MKLAPLVAVCLTMAAHTIMAIPIPPQDGTNVTLSARAENVTKRGEGPICVGKDEDCPIGTEKYWSLINCRVWDVIVSFPPFGRDKLGMN